MIVPFPAPIANDNPEEEIVHCAACKNVAVLVIVVEGAARFECAGCRADLTSGIIPLCEIEIGNLGDAS
jgi:hypothetical protein